MKTTPRTDLAYIKVCLDLASERIAKILSIESGDEIILTRSKVALDELEHALDFIGSRYWFDDNTNRVKELSPTLTLPQDE